MEIFHYTSIKAAISIISGSSFRATNMHDFSDDHELVGGLCPLCCSLGDLLDKCRLNGPSTFFTKIAKQVRDSAPELFYAISFCKNFDDPYMWNKYAKGEGCCICFDKEKLLEAFNSVIFSPNDVPRPFHPVNENFIPCQYYLEKDFFAESEKYLKIIKIPVKINGLKKVIPFDILTPQVSVNAKDQMEINLDDAFTSFVSFALCVKRYGTSEEYEKENEERLVFYPLPQYPVCSCSEKKYISIELDESLFLQSINRIQLSPTCPDSSIKITEIQNALAAIFERNGKVLPAIVEHIDPLG